LEETRIPFFDSCTFEFQGLKDYVSIGAPYILVVLLEYWVYEQMTLASGLLGVTEQACQVILIMLLNFNYMVASGIQTTTATVVGN
jgi:Na+-driven multidrug efflux pump